MWMTYERHYNFWPVFLISFVMTVPSSDNQRVVHSTITGVEKDKSWVSHMLPHRKFE